jgi:hypothetical protein
MGNPSQSQDVEHQEQSEKSQAHPDRTSSPHAGQKPAEQNQGKRQGPDSGTAKGEPAR